MAQRADLEEVSHPLHEAYACLLSNGLDGAGEALRILVNEASRIERAQHLQAMPYERSAQRVDQANGYKPKTMLTRMGEITFEVPQVRSGGFYPSALERGSRSEQSVNLALAEMYVQGVSTRKVIEVLQKLVGPDVSISSTQISRCAEKLDVGLEAWRNRPLDETPYVLLDARYERVREAGQVMDCAVLVAVGVTASGHRRVLGVSVALSEAEVHWRKEHPKLAAWAEENLTEGFAVFALPPEHRVRMRTTNGVERLNKEIKRRTRVATLFPNSASCLRLVSAILAEQDEEWLTAKIYLTMNL
jgi:transposase-like protein